MLGILGKTGYKKYADEKASTFDATMFLVFRYEEKNGIFMFGHLSNSSITEIGRLSWS